MSRFFFTTLFLCFLLRPAPAQEPSTNSAASADPTPPPTTSVQIVNATSVAAMSLLLNGQFILPNFSQGNHSAGGANDLLNVHYLATDNKTKLEAEKNIKYEPNQNQSLLITGDFSTDCPPENLPQPGEPSVPPPKPFKPNVQFRVLSHDCSSDEELRYRFINAMPHKMLELWLEDKLLAKLKPGDEHVLTKQAPSVMYQAKVDDTMIPTYIRQEGLIRNGTIIYFLRDDKPTFMRAYENTANSMAKSRQMEEEAEQ